MTLLPFLLFTTTFPKCAMSGPALVDFVRTHDDYFCSCSFWAAALFLLFRYYFSDERPFLLYALLHLRCFITGSCSTKFFVPFAIEDDSQDMKCFLPP